MNNIYKPKQIHLTTKHPLPQPIEPTCVSQALKDHKWQHTMSEEFNALVKHDTWELVSSNPSIIPVGCRWLFRIKHNADGTISRYKACLVAKGYHQCPGLDYNETFSPVVKPVTIRTVLSIAVQHRWCMKQLDVNNAFLHGSLQEDVYMIQPPGFVDSTMPTHICKLHKSIYGLKQAPRAWYDKLSSFLLTLGFQQSKSDSSLFIYSKKDIILFLLVYVDDVLLTGNDSQVMSDIIRQLGVHVSLKDLSDLHYFIGVEVQQTCEGIFLSQQKYIRDLLKRTNIEGARPIHTPLSTKPTLQLNDGHPPADQKQYRSVIGALQYLAITRPNIIFVVNKFAQFMHKPSQLHWISAKQVLRYLKTGASVSQRHNHLWDIINALC